MLQQKSKTKGDKAELIFYISLIAFPLIQVLIFYFVVNFNSILLAFKDYDGDGGVYFNKQNLFVNFKRFWDELTEGGAKSIILSTLKNSVKVWFFTAFVGTFLSVLFSYYIFKKWFLAKTFKFFLFLPSVLPSILLVFVFETFVNQVIPAFANEVLDKSVESLLQGEHKIPTYIFYNVWVCFGAQLLIYTGAMGQIAPETLEAGKVDGVNSFREFFSIVIPMILPTISTFMVANLATIFTNQANLFALYGNTGSESYLNIKEGTMGFYLFDLITKPGTKIERYPYASALGILCTLVAFPLTMGVRKLLNRGADDL